MLGSSRITFLMKDLSMQPNARLDAHANADLARAMPLAPLTPLTTLSPAPSTDIINIQHSEELERWVRALGVSEEQLRMAVAAVGAQVDDVRNHFGVVRTAA